MQRITSSLKVSNDFARVTEGAVGCLSQARGLDDELIRCLFAYRNKSSFNGELVATSADSGVELFRAPCPEHGSQLP